MHTKMDNLYTNVPLSEEIDNVIFYILLHIKQMSNKIKLTCIFYKILLHGKINTKKILKAMVIWSKLR